MTTVYWFKPTEISPQIAEPGSSMRDFRIPPRCQSNPRSFGILCSVDWLPTDV